MRLLCVLSLCLVAVSARADSRDEAKRHRAAGRAAFGAGHFAEALDEYQQSYKLREDPDLQPNTKSTHWKQRLAEEIEHEDQEDRR